MSTLKTLYTLLASAILCASAHACTLPKSYYKHVKCTSQAGVFLAVKDNGSPVALLDKKGNKSADLFAYTAVLPQRFVNGLLPVRQGNKVGYINKHGKVVIPLIYDSLGGSDWARGAYGGRIVVKKSGAFGMIDSRGHTIVAFDKNISHLGDMSKGSAAITKSGKKYRIDANGNALGNTTKPSAQASQNQSPPVTPAQSTPKLAHDTPFFPRESKGRWGFVDMDGTPMIVFVFDEVRPFSEGLAAVRQDTHWGFIDKSGALVVDFRFDDAGIMPESRDAPHLPEPFIFIHGKAWIGNLNNGHKLCINPQGVNVDCRTR